MDAMRLFAMLVFVLGWFLQVYSKQLENISGLYKMVYSVSVTISI